MILRLNIKLLYLLLVSFTSVLSLPEYTCDNESVPKQCNVSLIEGQPADTLVFNTTQYLDCTSCTILAASGNETAYEQNFRIDGATRIFTKIPLDREAMVVRSTAPLPVFLRVSIVAPGFITQIQITINIIDLNDNIPIFSSNGNPLPNSLNKTVHETMITGPLLTVEAIDYDEGANGTSSYVLFGQGEPPFFNLTVASYVAGRPSTAKLSNLLVLDRESNESFTVTIVAYEGTDNPQNDTLVVNINIGDVDDNVANFAPTQYTVLPSEGTPINTTLTAVMAYDDDTGTNAVIEYSIKRVCGKATESGFCGNLNEANYPFILDRESGELVLSKTLDYESTIEYRIDIDAFNPNNPSFGSSTALVTVKVQDLNDNAPVIIGLSSTLDLREDSQMSFSIKQIQVIDPDSENFSEFRVLLLDAETHQNSTVFGLQPSVNSYVSVIQLASIDREMKDRYDLIIRAEDLLNSTLYTEIEFSIIIIDVNDNSPIFNTPPNPVQVVENTNEAVVVLDLNATDADIGSNAEITYSISGSGNQNLFFIQSQTGKLLVQGSLDRETISSLQILVTATDNGDPSRSANITLNITILDINDNPAMINSSVPPQISVSEDAPVGIKQLFDVDAFDADIAPNNNISYKLVSDINPLPFHIDENGRITVNDTLDRDEEPSTYHIRVVVSDGVNQPDSRNFTVILTDVNDNNPVFKATEYFASFHENATAGMFVLQVMATDKDTPALTVLSYSIVAGNSEGHFTLEPSTGILRTSEPLDRESIANYTLEVRATDGERYSTMNALIHVSILDINDEIPVFVGVPYIFSINEGNAPMQFVDQVRATSIETGDNGVARYYINDEPNIPFIIDSVTGNITATTMLDREQRDEYTLVVRVEDVAPPPHFSTASVVITVNDINDSPPVFNPDYIPLTLSERTPVGSAIHIARATDADLPPYNVTKYSLSEPHANFSINTDTGSITLEASLDYDLNPNFLLTVIARDAVPPHYMDTLKINITVQPEPDNTCTFPPSFPTIYHVPEDAPINTPMIEFYGVDHNGNIVQNVGYHLTNTQPGEANPFGVSVPSENANATISTIALLNREIQPVYMLNVTITKTNDPSVSVTQILTIHLIDINDNSPIFMTPPYIFSAPEDLSQGEEIGERIKAKDIDFEHNGTVHYYLKEPSTIFNISQHSELQDSSQSGSLYLIGSLDREVQDSYILTVVGSDMGNPPMTSEVQVIVNVTDVNDNDPSFSPHIVEIKETVPVGEVIQLQGIDLDEGLNGEVVFSHQPGSTATEKFQLFKSGAIELIELLDFERKEEFIFFITVRDKGTPSRSSNGNLTIRVININEHSPEFLPIETPINILENYPILKKIVNITATDLDNGTAGVVMYQLADAADSKLFSLDSQSGVLQLETNLDYEKSAQHRVVVIAYDQGMPRNKISNTTVTINVGNVNEHPPTFDEMLFKVSIAENLPTANNFIATIRAYDQDKNTITYTISDTENFTYSPTTNSLSSKVIFDYETASLYTLTITATDGNYTTMAGIQVYIDNINDNPPMFTANQYMAQVLENIQVGTTILYVHAEDRDNLTNNAVQYSITSGNAGDAFAVHEYTGAISINSALDFEDRQQYSLTVVARDSGIPQESAQTTVIIEVINVNEFTPQFSQDVYNFNVTEESPTGANIGKVTALDDDEGTFTDVTYSLQVPSEYFTLDAQTGVIRVALPIDRESIPNPPPLMVVATDGEKSSTATVNIILQDINDRRPIFPMKYYKFSITSSQSPLSSFGNVSAIDADTGSNSITIYSLSGSLQGLPLAISMNTGGLYLTQSLQSGHQYSYKVTVTAVDSQNAAFSDQTEVEIFIVGTNDHPPCFPQYQYTISVVENAVLTAPIITVTANDPDTGSNGDLSYSFAEVNDFFSINTGNGAISLTSPLDYEMASEYNLTVIAQDGTSNTPRTASALVQVKVNNTDDNSPIVANSAITFSPVPFTGVSLFTAEATDKDGSSLTFDLNSYTDRFHIDQESGLVTNKMVLSSGNSYDLIIVASDGFHPSTTGTVSVTITELPPNVSSFLQSSPVQLTIPENSPLMTILNVTTTGSTPSMYLLAKVSPHSDAFSVNPSTGALSIVSNLDYEQHTAYDLVIEARNVTGTTRYSRFLHVQINVTNINEFVPVFTEKRIERTIGEGISGQVVIAQVQANDLDSGSFGEIRYTISDNGGLFTIGETSGIIVKPVNMTLDREVTSRYTLTVTATDLGGRSSVATVIVDVEDENDTPPQFPGNYTIGVFEPGSVGDIVIRIQANDPDTQSSLAYSLGPVSSFLGSESKGSAPNTFGINSATGEVTLDITLNREAVDRYIVPASVTDGIRTSTTYITVTVQDINDNAPAFTANTIEASIDELSPVGSSLYHIHATDADVGSNGIVHYNLSGFQNWFAIDPITGVIRVSQVFTYEQFHTCLQDGPELTGTVEATDGMHTATLTLEVEVNEINNHAPVFVDSPYLIRIAETKGINQPLMNIQITDSDCGSNSAYTTDIPQYYLAARHLFRWDILSTGHYQLLVRNILQPGIYHFRIQAFNEDPRPDSPELYLAGYAHVTIAVLPQNKYSPEFNSSTYLATVKENVEINTEVVLTSATDDDPGSSGVVTYTLGGENIPFAVNSNTGAVYTTNQLDRETIPSYSFQLVATDHGIPPKNATATVFIVLSDVNDLAPVFNSPSFRGNVTENVASGTLILQVFAKDDDLLSGGEVRYSLPPSPPLPFTINEESGELSTYGMIDFEDQSEYQFQVKAQDRGSPPLSSFAQVIISIIGEDEHEPVFSDENRMYSVKEDAMKGEVIGTISAIDEDDGNDGQVGFLLLNVSREGLIDLRNGTNNTGEIILIYERPERARALRVRRQDVGVSLTATIGIVAANGDGSVSSTTTFTVMFPPGFVVTTTESAPSPQILIPIVSVVAAVGVLAAAMLLVCFAVMFRMKSKKKGKYDPRSNNLNHSQRTTMSEVNNYEMGNVAAVTSAQQRAEESNVSPNDMEEFDSADLASPITSTHQLPRNRSTSDLASTVATDVLTQDTVSFQYNKAQIEAIYAANANLLHDVSQDSVHSFNSEGGGEADGNVDIDNMMFAKYDLDTEGSMTHFDDDYSYDDKDRQSFTDSSGREEYHFTQSTNLWSSRPGSLAARSIAEMSTPGETRSSMYHSNALYEPSQGPVSAYGYSTQGSNVSLLRHNRYGHSEHDIHAPHHQVYDEYFPDAEINHHAPYPTDMYSHAHPHSHTQVNQYEAGPMEYRPSGARSYQFTQDPPLSHPPPLSHYSTSYYPGHSEAATSQRLLRTFEPMLSSSSTSLSTNASHPLPRHPATYGHMDGYHPN